MFVSVQKVNNSWKKNHGVYSNNQDEKKYEPKYTSEENVYMVFHWNGGY